RCLRTFCRTAESITDGVPSSRSKNSERRSLRPAAREEENRATWGGGRSGMKSLRMVPNQRLPAVLPCCRCASAECSWDRIAAKAYCPECQEALVMGLADALVERTEKNHCGICSRVGTVRFLTFPLQIPTPVEMDLCPEHLRALLGRRLSTVAFDQL